jgi:hypothetical protein
VRSGLGVGSYGVERLPGPKIAQVIEQLSAFERRGTIWLDRGRTLLTFA